MHNHLPPLALLLGAVCLLLAGCIERPAEPGPERTVEVRPEVYASVAGQVVTPEDTVGYGVLVFAEGTSHAAYSDQLGFYVLSGLAPGEYRLRALRHDLEPALIGEVVVQKSDLKLSQPFQDLGVVQMAHAPLPEAAGGPARGAVALGSVLGRVVTTSPADTQGVVVEVAATDIRTVTDSAGMFTLRNLEAGNYTLRITRRGYAPKTITAQVESGRDLRLPDVALNLVDSSAAIAGRTLFGDVVVFDANGDRMSDFSAVTVALLGTATAATVNRAGQFTFRGLAPDVYTVAARADGFVLEEEVTVDLTELQGAEVGLVLREIPGAGDLGGVVAGRLVVEDPGGNPRGATVSLAGTSFIATTDASGAFRIEGVPEGLYDLIASLAGYETAVVEGIEVLDGEETMVGDVALSPEVDAPRVVSTTPVDGAVDVTIEEQTLVVVEFDQPMDQQSLRRAISISPSVDFTVRTLGQHPMATDDRVVIELAGHTRQGTALRFGTQYRLGISRDAANREGVPLDSAFEMRFRTGEAKIIATRPADGERDAFVFETNPIRIYFNTAVEIERMDVSDIRIRPDLNAQPRYYLQRDSRTGWGVLVISGTFEFGQDYTVSIRGGVSTPSGQRISNIPYTFQFTTLTQTEGAPWTN